MYIIHIHIPECGDASKSQAEPSKRVVCACCTANRHTKHPREQEALVDMVKPPFEHKSCLSRNPRTSRILAYLVEVRVARDATRAVCGKCGARAQTRSK